MSVRLSGSVCSAHKENTNANDIVNLNNYGGRYFFRRILIKIKSEVEFSSIKE